MAFFDQDLTFAPVAERNTDPILPEERFVFELIGLERSEPDQWRKSGGIKWTFRVLYENGAPFIFQDEPYDLWRTTGVNANGTPLMNIGTQANDWASALLGRQLGVDDTLRVSDLRGKRMSAMVVWRPKKTDPKSKTIDLASLRHVANAPQKPAPGQVSADPTADDVDRALVVTKLQKQVARLKKLDAVAGAEAAKALAESDLEDAPFEALQALSASFATAITNALEED